jgi:hypothetical protein
MANQVEKHIFFNEQGERIVVARLDNDAIRIRYESPRRTAVTWHATGNQKHSTTIVTPETAKS